MDWLIGSGEGGRSSRAMRFESARDDDRCYAAVPFDQRGEGGSGCDLWNGVGERRDDVAAQKQAEFMLVLSIAALRRRGATVMSADRRIEERIRGARFRSQRHEQPAHHREGDQKKTEERPTHHARPSGTMTSHHDGGPRRK